MTTTLQEFIGYKPGDKLYIPGYGNINVLTPFNAGLPYAFYVYNPSTKRDELVSTNNNLGLAKAIGDAIGAFSKKFTEFMTKTVVPFMIGVIGLIIVILAIGYVFR